MKSLCRKADQNRSIHSMIRDKIILVNKLFLLYVSIGSAICAMLIFASIPVAYQLWAGVFSATVFVVSIIPSTLNFDIKILERATAVQLWGEWVRDAKNFYNLEINQMELSFAVLKQKELIATYKKVMENTAQIPDSEFIKYKRLHLQKVEISNALDKNPFRSLRKIKKELHNNRNS